MQVNPDVGSMDAVLDKLYGKVGTTSPIYLELRKERLSREADFSFVSLMHWA